MVNPVTSQAVNAGHRPILSGVSQPLSGAANANTGANSPLSGYAASPAAQQLQNALQALKTLRSQSVSASSAQRSAAKQKLDQLKAQLKALQEFGGDPKTRAREAAAIAKQIAEAARDYASAGGDPGVSDTVAPPPASAPSSDETQADDASAEDGQAASANVASSPTSTGASSTAPDDTAESATDASTPSADLTTPQNVPSDPAGTATAPSAHAITAPPTAPTTTGGLSKTDQDFFNEAHDLAKQAKAIIEHAVRSLRASGHPVDPKIASAGYDAEANIQQAEDALSAPTAQGPSGPAATPATSTVSVTA